MLQEGQISMDSMGGNNLAMAFTNPAGLQYRIFGGREAARFRNGQWREIRLDGQRPVSKTGGGGEPEEWWLSFLSRQDRKTGRWGCPECARLDEGTAKRLQDFLQCGA